MTYTAVVLTEESIDQYNLTQELKMTREALLDRIAEDRAKNMATLVYLVKP